MSGGTGSVRPRITKSTPLMATRIPAPNQAADRQPRRALEGAGVKASGGETFDRASA